MFVYSKVTHFYLCSLIFFLRWRENEILTHEGSYSPLHVHAQTFASDGQELSDAECDRDLRYMSDNGT